MRARTIATLLLVLALVWLLVSTIRLNESPVTLRFVFAPPIELELWMALLLSAGVGAGAILLVDLVGGVRRFARVRRERRQSELDARTEDLYVDGLVAMANGQYETASSRFEAVLAEAPGHENAHLEQGRSLMALERHREAVEVLERAAANAPDSVRALYPLAEVYFAANAPERAKSVLERIIELAPESALTAYRRLRDRLVDESDWEEAAAVQERLSALVGRDGEGPEESVKAMGIRLGLAVSHMREGRLDDAIAGLRAILDDDESFVPAHVRLGEALAMGDEPERAAEAWKRGYEATGSTEPLTALQELYLSAEQPEDAIAVWKQALVLSDDEVPLRYCLGKLHYRLFMLDEALHELQLIEDRVSGLPALQLHLARILEAKSDPAAALAKTKLLVGEVEGLMMDYSCEACAWRSAEWAERCTRCGRWASVKLHLPEAQSPEPDIRPSPTWSTS